MSDSKLLDCKKSFSKFYDFYSTKVEYELSGGIVFHGMVRDIPTIVSLSNEEVQLIETSVFNVTYLIVTKKIKPFVVKNFIPLGGN